MMYNRSIRRKSKQAQEFVWPAPVAGLIRSGAKINSDPRGCEVLENYIPTAEGARLRGGSERWSRVDGTPQTMFTYRSGSLENLFAATATSIFNASATSPTLGVPAVASLSGGDWSTVQFATPGGQFVIAVNGSDLGMRFDGTEWNVMVDTDQNSISYESLSAPFVPGQTVSNGTSIATILAVLPATETTGELIIGPVIALSAFSDEFTAEFY